MTAQEPRRPTVSRKGWTGHVLFAMVLLVIARFLWLRDQPERLGKGRDGNSKIFGATLYTVVGGGVNDPAAFTLQAQSIHGGANRAVSREEAHYQGYHSGWSNAFSIVDGKLYYAVEPRPRPRRLSTAEQRRRESSGIRMVIGFVPETRRFLGSFLPQPIRPAGSEATGQSRTSLPEIAAPTEVHFREVAVDGGTARDAAICPSASVCVVRDQVFWIRPGPDTNIQVSPKPTGGHQSYWQEVTAHSDLMLTSLSTGTTRRIRSGIPVSTYLRAGDSGVVWEEPAPFPGRPTVFYARASDGSVRSLGTHTEGSHTLGDLYVEAGDRLYWTYIVDDNTLGRAKRRGVLMSAKRDGTEVREIFAQREHQSIESLLIHAYRGGLYCCFTQVSTTTRGDSKRTRYLCRVRPERPDPIDIVHKLPEHSSVDQFDGGYLYFNTSEEKRSLWATLTSDDANAESAITLCRFPIDH